MTDEDQAIRELDIGDPRDHWISQSHQLASKLSLPVDFINETRDIVEGAFGCDWLSEIFGKPRSKHTLVPKAHHHLDTLFGVAGECQVVELIELAVYLKRLAICPNVADVINVMKNHYATGFLQLAYAYRFQRAGAENIELEPPTDRGKSDIFFVYGNQPFLVECYVPSIADKTNSIENLRKCSGMVFRACDANSDQLRVSIRLKQSISVQQGKQLGWWLANQIRRCTSGHLTAEHEFAQCDVKPVESSDDETDCPRPMNPQELRDAPDIVISPYSVPVSDIEKVRLGEPVRRRDGSRLLIWRPESERKELTEAEYIEELDKRISEKLKQTKRKSDNPARLVIAQVAKFMGDEDRALRVSRKLQQNLMPRYENVSAILLVQRSWVRESRYQFHGVILGGRRATSCPEKLFEIINTQEQNEDILADWR